MRVKFWGVRGSIPACSVDQAQTGGDTSCIEVECDGRPPVIIDAGTGLRPLGLDLVGRGGPGRGRAIVLLSHLHWDHVQGIPFFAPMYEADWTITFYSALLHDETSQAVRLQTSSPYFPGGWALRAKVLFEELRSDGVEIGGMNVHPFPLNHPGGSSGFRFEAGGRAVVYVSDHEHGNASVDAGIREVARDADVLIWDSGFTPEDYPLHQGWGHSTWLEGARMAAAATVKQLVLHHHDPTRTDSEVERIEAAARLEFPNTVAARQGLTLTLPLSDSAG